MASKKRDAGITKKKWSATSDEKKVLRRHFPLIWGISDQSGLRDMVIEVWVRLWRESGYRDIGESPNLPNEDELLVSHTNLVARMARVAAIEFEKVYHTCINYDFLLAGAFLHDVDKLVVFGHGDGSSGVDAPGKEMVHGKYGALVAEQVGLPPEVVNIIASHSAVQPSAAPATVEAIIVADCDHASFRSYRLMSGLALT